MEITPSFQESARRALGPDRVTFTAIMPRTDRVGLLSPSRLHIPSVICGVRVPLRLRGRGFDEPTVIAGDLQKRGDVSAA